VRTPAVAKLIRTAKLVKLDVLVNTEYIKEHEGICYNA